MSEYIEREPLIKYCTAMLNLAQRHVQSGHGESDIWKAIHRTQQEERKEFLELLKNAPAADVAPVWHGRWIGLEYDGYADGEPVYDLWECSECGEEVRGEDVPDTHPWCHSCGAQMDGKVNKHEISES